MIASDDIDMSVMRYDRVQVIMTSTAHGLWQLTLTAVTLPVTKANASTHGTNHSSELVSRGL